MVRIVALLTVALSSVGCFEADLGVEALHPVADAGFDQRRYLGASGSIAVEIDGRASCDPQGSPLGLATFEIVDGPERPMVSVLDRLRGLFEVQQPGEVLVALRVRTDDPANGPRESAPDYVVVTVLEGDGDDVVMPPPSTNACGQPLDLGN
jgi:hypothetical protein